MLFENCTHPALFLCPPQKEEEGGTEAEEGMGKEGPVYVVYIPELLLVSAAACQGQLLGSIGFCYKEAEKNRIPAFSPTRSGIHCFFAPGSSC